MWFPKRWKVNGLDLGIQKYLGKLLEKKRHTHCILIISQKGITSIIQEATDLVTNREH